MTQSTTRGPVPPAPPVAPTQDVAPARRVDRLGAGVLAAAAAAILATFLPWTQDPGGVDGLSIDVYAVFPAGRMILLLGVLVVALGMRQVAGQATRLEHALVLGAGLGTMGLAVRARQRLDEELAAVSLRLADSLRGTLEQASGLPVDPNGPGALTLPPGSVPGLGYGIWVALAAGLAMVVLAVVRLLRD